MNESDAAAEMIKRIQHRNLLDVVQIDADDSHDDSNLHRVAVSKKVNNQQKMLLIQKNRSSAFKQPVQLSHHLINVITQNVNNLQNVFDCCFILNQHKLS